MAIRITIDVFSGRPNPTFELAGDETGELLERLRPTGERIEEKRSLPNFRLGYRGIIIEHTEDRLEGLPGRVRVAGGAAFSKGRGFPIADPDFEEFVCGSTGPIRLPEREPDLADLLMREIKEFHGFWQEWRPQRWPWPTKLSCRCAPLYEPDWWNDGGQRQFNNNCYNYGTNYRSDTFAQPGLADGSMYTTITCPEVRAAAIRDELIDQPDADNKCPQEGHLVALVVGPNWDFHWYRKGRNGLWTHKPGGTPVTNLDNSGNLISDPRTADRGFYTDFCTFMVVMHGHVKVE